ncbi:MAG: hypothetical protein KC777_03425 [Cyanobacteria bacterium HKST-UBA02]|nr:hypothetical protein [Cyanobacteria bacterium HKST-UBA02]
MIDFVETWVCTLCGEAVRHPVMEATGTGIIPRLLDTTSCRECGAGHEMFSLEKLSRLKQEPRNLVSRANQIDVNMLRFERLKRMVSIYL